MIEGVASSVYSRQDVAVVAADIMCLIDHTCDDIQVAGSLRRKRSVMTALTIVCLPKIHAVNDGGWTLQRSREFVDKLKEYNVVVGDPDGGKYVKIAHTSGIPINVYITTKDNFGLMLALRTGPLSWSKDIPNILRPRYRIMNGHVYENGSNNLITIRHEHELFQIMGKPFIHPECRI